MSTAPKRKNLQQKNREFINEVFEKQKATLKSKRGPKPKPASERQGKNVIKVYANDKEYETIKNFVGGRSMSDVIRQMILDAADELESE